MFSTEYESLANTVYDDTPSGSALYALWRSKGSWALLLRMIVAQFTMAGVLFVFYVLAVAVDYSAFHHRAQHPMCPQHSPLRAAQPNQATVFETDCWGETPINVHREPSWIVVFVVVSAAVCMTIEGMVCVLTWQELRHTESWWQRQSSNSQPMREIDWEGVYEIVSAAFYRKEDGDWFVSSVTRRSDSFVRLYTGPLKYLCCIPRTLHNAINTTVLLHRYTGWTPIVCFRGVALILVVAIPYLLVATVCQFVFRNGAVLRGGSSAIGLLVTKRQWSRKAQWTMRNEGELTHRFEERMERAALPASRVLNAMPVPHWVQTLATMVLVLSAAFMTAVLFVTLLVDDVLFSVYLSPGRTAGFYAGVAGLIMAIVSPMAIKPKPTAFDQELALLHEIAPKLLENASTIDDQAKQVDRSMHYWGQEFIIELFSLLTTPWVLLWLPAEQVMHVLRS